MQGIFRDKQQTKFTQKGKGLLRQSQFGTTQNSYPSGTNTHGRNRKSYGYPKGFYYFTIFCMFEFSFIYFDFHCFIIYYFLLGLIA